MTTTTTTTTSSNTHHPQLTLAKAVYVHSPVPLSPHTVTAAFRELGPVRAVAINKNNPHGARVDFATREAAQRAMELNKRAAIDNHRVTISSYSYFSKATQIYVGNLPYSVDEQTLQEIFSRVGEILHIDKDPSDSFAHIFFFRRKDVTQALELNGINIDGNSISVRKPFVKYQVFVRNIAFSATQEDIAEVFMKVCPVRKVELPKNNNGQIKGFGFVNLENEEDIEKALTINGYQLLGRDLHVTQVKKKNN